MLVIPAAGSRYFSCSCDPKGYACLNLAGDPPCEFGRGDFVQCHSHRATQHASIESGGPFSAIFTPDEDAVALLNTHTFEFACNLGRGFRDPWICPTNRAVSFAIYKRQVARVLTELLNVLSE